MRSGFWKADWCLGLAVVVLFACLHWTSDLLPGFERTPSDKVAIIAIEQRSIDNSGRWP